jgi:hypothetical protein
VPAPVERAAAGDDPRGRPTPVQRHKNGLLRLDGAAEVKDRQSGGSFARPAAVTTPSRRIPRERRDPSLARGTSARRHPPAVWRIADS